MVIVKKDSNLTKDAVVAHCKEHPTGYKRLPDVELRDALPKTSIGKVPRRELR